MQLSYKRFQVCVVVFSVLFILAPNEVSTYANFQALGMRDFGNRLEGTTFQLNALNDFTFVALHRHSERFSKGSSLNVRFFLPQTPSGNTKVFVEALELQDSLHYFMSSKEQSWRPGAWNIFRPWPSKDVIDPLGIVFDNLGVRAAFQVDNKTRVYLPVDLYSTTQHITERSYTFYYVTAQDLQSIDISVTNANGQMVSIAKPSLQCNKKRNPNCILYAAGNTFNFRLDFSPLPEGQYYVHLVGRVPRTSQATSAITRLYHPQRSEKAH